MRSLEEATRPPLAVTPSSVVSLSTVMHPSFGAGVLGPDALAVAVEGLARSAANERLDIGQGEARAYRRIFSSGNLEAWLIAWGEGSCLGLHDHGGSNGAFTLVSGSLLELSVDLATSERPKVSALQQGSIRRFGATYVHEVWNPRAPVAMSVHAYSPPLETMHFYD
ncbi:MAG: hypothetical protein JWM85_3361 [Acidimicrobiaceae bacterium]|nr:hypothetical protein [Acidimicrobiaceae bacterium]